MIEFRVNKLSEILGVHRNTITNWIKSGKLKAVPSIAKRYVISKEDLLQIFKEEGIGAESIEKLKIVNGIKSKFSEDLKGLEDLKDIKDVKEFKKIKKKFSPKKQLAL